MKKALVIFAMFSTFIISSCGHVAPKINSDLVIVSGQRFGMCSGECTQYLRLTAQTPDVQFISQPNFIDFKNERKTFTDALDEQIWKNILAELNTRAFRKLKKVYGCPDCADGGAEWLEISDRSGTYKVTFEYGDEVKGIENLIILLRNQRTALSKKYLPSN